MKTKREESVGDQLCPRSSHLLDIICCDFAVVAHDLHSNDQPTSHTLRGLHVSFFLRSCSKRRYINVHLSCLHRNECPGDVSSYRRQWQRVVQMRHRWSCRLPEGLCPSEDTFGQLQEDIRRHRFNSYSYSASFRLYSWQQ